MSQQTDRRAANYKSAVGAHGVAGPDAETARAEIAASSELMKRFRERSAKNEDFLSEGLEYQRGPRGTYPLVVADGAASRAAGARARRRRRRGVPL